MQCLLWGYGYNVYGLRYCASAANTAICWIILFSQSLSFTSLPLPVYLYCGAPVRIFRALTKPLATRYCQCFILVQQVLYAFRCLFTSLSLLSRDLLSYGLAFPFIIFSEKKSI